MDNDKIDKIVISTKALLAEFRMIASLYIDVTEAEHTEIWRQLSQEMDENKRYLKEKLPRYFK